MLQQGQILSLIFCKFFFEVLKFIFWQRVRCHMHHSPGGYGGMLTKKIVKKMKQLRHAARISTVGKCLRQVQKYRGVNYIQKDNHVKRYKYLTESAVSHLKIINSLNQKPMMIISMCKCMIEFIFVYCAYCINISLVT